MGKKRKKADFQKVKLKVGKRLPKNLNETQINLQTRKILVHNQDLIATREFCADDEIRFVLKKLKASQSDERLSGVEKLINFVGSHSHIDEFLSMNDFMRDIAPLLRDHEHSTLRTKAIQLFDLLVSKLGHIYFYHTAFLHCLSTTWNHLDEKVNADSLKILNILLDKCPTCLIENRIDLFSCLVRLYEKLRKGALMREAKYKLAVLYAFCKFIGIINNEHFRKNNNPVLDDNASSLSHMEIVDYDVYSVVRDSCKLSWDANLQLNDVEDTANADLWKNFLNSVFSLLQDCFSVEELDANTDRFEHFKNLCWCFKCITVLHYFEDHKAADSNRHANCEFCKEKLWPFAEKNLVSSFPLEAISFSKKRRANPSASKIKEINMLLLEIFVSTPCLIQFLPPTFSKKVYDFLFNFYSGRLNDSEMRHWLAFLSPLLTEYADSTDSHIIKLFTSFVVNKIKDLGTTSDILPQALDLVTTAALMRLRHCANNTLDSLLFLPGFLLNQFDSLKLHTVASTSSPAVVALATCTVKNLLKLESASFPGARDVLCANSFRLITHCPDSLLRRELNILVE